MVDGERRRSYADLLADFRRVTAGLMVMGVRRGDRIAIWAPNRYEWLVCALGIVGAGAAVVPVNTRFRRDEVRYILERSGVRAVFAQGTFLDADYGGTLSGLRKELPRLELVVGFDPDSAADHSLESFLRTGACSATRRAASPVFWQARRSSPRRSSTWTTCSRRSHASA